MTEKILNILEKYGADGAAEWIEAPAMARYTSFRIGGKADFLVYPKTVEALVALIDCFELANIQYLVLGRMTNILFSDDGYRGAVICTSRIKKLSFNGTFVCAECGVSLAELCRFARDASLSGHEFAYGIPGSVGGAIFMNAGAYGGEMSHIVHAVTYYDAKLKRIQTASSEDCGFSYRSSVFRADSSKIVLRVEFRFTEGEKEAIRRDMEERIAKRAATQPLEHPNAGSIFKRSGSCIVSKLIDEMGLKGYRVGGAEVSRKHAGFIVNTGNATAQDVCTLIQRIKTMVIEQHGIFLEEEILYIE